MINDKHFSDWEAHVFGFGYGTGEEHVIKPLYDMLMNMPPEGSYDYKVLEKGLGPQVFWLLLNVLCHDDMIEYGTSPRYGWLTERGKHLRQYLVSVGLEKAIEAANTDFDHCYPTYCNCEQPCKNPLFKERAR